MAKGARGKPCRCGSGRPSEECCGGDGGSPTPTNRATRDSTLAKLLAFAFQPAFDSDHTIAETIFWGDVLTSARPDELAWLLDSQDANIKYNAWFLFDWD